MLSLRTGFHDFVLSYLVGLRNLSSRKILRDFFSLFSISNSFSSLSPFSPECSVVQTGNFSLNFAIAVISPVDLCMYPGSGID